MAASVVRSVNLPALNPISVPAAHRDGGAFGQRVTTKGLLARIWEMHDSVATDLGIAGVQGASIPPIHCFSRTNCHLPLTYVEGAAIQVTTNCDERNRAARTACIDHYGVNCTVCGFNFASEFGELGDGFIHVHHLIPISEIGENYVVDPIADLRPVCH